MAVPRLSTYKPMSLYARIGLLAVLVALLAPVVATARAAERHVPFGFYGVMWDREVASAPGDVQDAQWDLMAESGVESVRTVISWAGAQPSPRGPIDFSYMDALVRRAAAHHIELLPVVLTTPVWARAYRDRLGSPPRKPATYAAFLAELVQRYGPSGTFWTQNPDLEPVPVRQWQVWNEPHLQAYWDVDRGSPWAGPRGYGRLLRASYRAIKSRDPGAEVVLAGITQKAWNVITRYYRRGGIKHFFDAAALNTFPQTVHRAVRASQLFRAAMRRAGDGRKPFYVTEITWPASKGHTQGIPFQKQETPEGMATKLRGAFARLASKRNRLGVARVYWYTWASPYGSGGSVFSYGGLLRYDGGEFTPQPALDAYRGSAQAHQGCVKDSTGACT
jgi:hypothetical protein